MLIDPDALCDVMIKRIHEYKRQLLKLLHVVTLVNRIKNSPGTDLVPRSVVFAGKSARVPAIMKLALGGAVTIGTLDGANIEIRDRVGSDNFFLTHPLGGSR